MPKVCVLDTGLSENLGIDTAQGSGPGGLPGAGGQGSLDSIEMIMNYFGGPDTISRERCQTIVTKSEIELGEYDFVYEWQGQPTKAQREILEEKIAKALKPINVKYKIHNK